MDSAGPGLTRGRQLQLESRHELLQPGRTVGTLTRPTSLGRNTEGTVPDRFGGMQDPPQVIEITVEVHSDGRGLGRLGDRGRRAIAAFAVAAFAVVAAIVIIGPLFSGTGRTTAGLPTPSALRCDNGPTDNVFFGYRPPRAATPAKPRGCP